MKLECRLLEKSFGRRQVVNGISLYVNSGEVCGLLGPNGAGKTTTFHMLVGFLEPDAGKVFLDGRDATKEPMYARARGGIGYLAQEPTVFRGLTVAQNLEAILERTTPDRKVMRERVDSTRRIRAAETEGPEVVDPFRRREAPAGSGPRDDKRPQDHPSRRAFRGHRPYHRQRA